MAKTTTAGRKRVRFQLQAESGREVFIAGSFNGWQASCRQLKESGGVYSATMMLPKGRFEYKFVVDGVWCIDPDCPEWSQNGFGSLNSVITVG